MRFGIFMGPFHRVSDNATLALERDLQLVEHLDRIGFDEVWFGEHHSGGHEIVPGPEMMVAAAAQRTTRIRLGTGVISLPYHHPLVVADRIVFLDHLTRGRFTAGFGPGALPADSYMMGLDSTELRTRMEESLEAILALLQAGAGESVDRKTDWFELREARLHVPSHTRPHVPLAVAASVSPAGPRLAGRHGLGLISFSVASAAGFQGLAETWSVVEDEAQRHGQAVSRDQWGLVGMLHVAETMEQAIEETRPGLAPFFRYLASSSLPPLWDWDDPPSHEGMVARVNESGTGLIGTPAMAVEFLARYERQSGGFGAFLFFHNEWADRTATERAYELFAREVVPRFDGRPDLRAASYEWKKANRPMLSERFVSGVEAARRQYADERAAREP